LRRERREERARGQAEKQTEKETTRGEAFGDGKRASQAKRVTSEVDLVEWTTRAGLQRHTLRRQVTSDKCQFTRFWEIRAERWTSR
jgi:hypothetical protein